MLEKINEIIDEVNMQVEIPAKQECGGKPSLDEEAVDGIKNEKI